jgi:hypothetical protein
VASAFGGQRSIQLSYGCLWQSRRVIGPDVRRKLIEGAEARNRKLFC